MANPQGGVTDSSSGNSQITINRLAVATSDIEKGLERLRMTHAPGVKKTPALDPSTAGIPQPRMRAVLANIIVLVRADGKFGDEKNLDSFISRLAVAHPSRFFIIRLHDEGSASITSQVISRQIVPDSGAHLFSEEIYLDVAGEGTHFVPNLLLSLFIADVDVVLVIPETLGRKEHEIQLLRDLRKLSRLVLFDSSSFARYGADVKHLLDQCGSLEELPREDHFPQAKRFSDLAWRRTKRWRSLLGECFDSERLVSRQTEVSRIKIFVCAEVEEIGQGKISSDAFLMAGWCAACLSWDLEDVRWRTTPRGIMVEIHQQNRKDSAQLEFISWKQNTLSEKTLSATRDTSYGLAGLEIVLDPDKEALRLKIVRVFERGAAEIILGATSPEKASGSCEFSVRYTPFFSEEVDELVFRDILSNRGEDVYRAALENSLRIADAISETLAEDAV